MSEKQTFWNDYEKTQPINPGQYLLWIEGEQYLSYENKTHGFDVDTWNGHGFDTTNDCYIKKWASIPNETEKIEISIEQVMQFNSMLNALKTICEDYHSPESLADTPEAEGLGFEEVLSMAYENIRVLASIASHGVFPIQIQHGKGE